MLKVLNSEFWRGDGTEGGGALVAVVGGDDRNCLTMFRQTADDQNNLFWPRRCEAQHRAARNTLQGSALFQPRVIRTFGPSNYTVYGVGPEMCNCVPNEAQLNVRKGDAVPPGDIYLSGASGLSNYPPAEPEALRLLAPQRGLIATESKSKPKAPHRNTDTPWSVASNLGGKDTAGFVKLLLPPRQSRGGLPSY